MLKWRDLMKYPALIGKESSRDVEETLDTMDELIPIEEFKNERDRVGVILAWIRAHKEAGLIDGVDKGEITMYFIHGPGGL
jgi:hypothetical protein